MREIHLDDVDEAALDERRGCPPSCARARRSRSAGASPLRTRFIASGFSGGIGSSIHSGSNGSSSVRDPHRRRRREAAVHLDHDLHVRADRLANSGDDLDRAPRFGRRELGAGGAEGIELERAIAAVDDLARERARSSAGSRSAWYQPLAYARHAIAKAAAEQLPDRHAERLPHQVPASDVERRERRLRHLARAAVVRRAGCSTPAARRRRDRCRSRGAARARGRTATSVSVRLTIRTSPRPTRPSSVTSSTNTSSRHGVPTTVVRTSEMVRDCTWGTSQADGSGLRAQGSGQSTVLHRAALLVTSYLSLSPEP